MVSFREARRQSRIPKKCSMSQKRVRRRHRASLDKFITNLEHETYGTQSVHSVKTNKQRYRGKSENLQKHK